MKSKSSPLDDGGFVVPYGMQTWRSFVEDGDLGRTLVRLCVLAERAVPLSFVLDRGPAFAVKVSFVLAGESIDVVCGPELVEEPAADGLVLILRRLNAVLRSRQSDRRFVLDEKNYRLLLLDVRGAVWAAQRSWLAEKCLEPEASIDAKEPRSGRDLPRLRAPEEIVPPKRHFQEDPSYPGLLAEYFLRLAAFAGAGPVTCEPTPSLAPLFRDADFFSLRVTWQFSKGGSVQETVRIRTDARVPLQPICDALNHGLALRREDRRKKGPRLQAYLCASSPWGQHVVLATAAEAARLRRHAYLIEPEPSVADTERLGDAGFELPYLGGYWHNWGQLDRSLARTCLLARGRVELSFTTAREGDGAIVVRYQAGSETAAFRYATVTGKEEVVEVLPRVYRDLNTFLAALGIAHRFVMLTAEPRWYTPRVLLLDPEAVAAIRNAPGAYLACLPAVEASPLPAPTAHPESRLAEAPALVQTVAEIVGERHVLDSDFKCSSRETDYPELVEEIARFAKVSVRVEPLAVADESVSYYDVRVSHEGTGAVIRLENEKYAQVGPILDYLNPLLAARGDPRALYRFDGGGFEGGVVSATSEEAARLREAGYLVEQGAR